MKYNIGSVMLILAAIIATISAIAHSSCIILGPECYAFQMAPTELFESAKAGTLLAPIATLLVSGVFIIWAAYSLSAAKLIRTLPLLSLGVNVISFLRIVSGVLGIQLWLRKPEIVNHFAIISGWV